MDNPPTDNKFIVFRRDEWDRFAEELDNDGEAHLPTPVSDAVVIRRCDLAAPMLFDAYHHFYMALVEAYKIAGHTELHDRCFRVADYFQDQSVAAWETDRRIPS